MIVDERRNHLKMKAANHRERSVSCSKLDNKINIIRERERERGKII